MGLDADQVTLLRQALDQNDATGRWRSVLTTLLPTGVADMLQLEAATGLTRDQLKGLLIKFGKATGGGPPLLYRVEVKVPRPGQRGRMPTIYRLGEAGAAVLKAEGFADARPCGLASAVAISHAVAMLDVCLAARQAGLAVITDRELTNGQGKTLRPDNLVALDGGVQALFETEQAARTALLPRIVESIQHKAAFFRALDDGRLSPIVRVLCALPRGRDLERTWQVWERAAAAVADSLGGVLPFKLMALPLDEFLARPDWAEPPDGGRWRNLLNPALLAGFAAPTKATAVAPAQGSSPATLAVTAKQPMLPAPLARYTSTESRLVLTAMWQVFRESASAQVAVEPRPDPAFFELMTMIYLAGHPPTASVLARAGLPRASWWFLGEYLRMHVPLRDALNVELTRGGMTWNAGTIKHRMQKVVDVFLAYHGFRSDGPLFACADGAAWDEQTTRQFFVRVTIRTPELLLGDGDGDGVVPPRREVELAERALAWVLWTLFANGEEIGLKRPPYW